jgi:hypothetical protein
MFLIFQAPLPESSRAIQEDTEQWRAISPLMEQCHGSVNSSAVAMEKPLLSRRDDCTDFKDGAPSTLKA